MLHWDLVRYCISDRRLCGGLPHLIDFIARQMASGVDYIQIREKDLPVRELLALVSAVIARRGPSRSKILVNDRADVALAAGADGVHLPSYAPFDTLGGLVVARSCHTIGEIRSAKADFVTFSPIFPTPGKGQAVGLDALRHACKYRLPVFALGGITSQNSAACIEAGAAGIAGIRLFLDRELREPPVSHSEEIF